MKKLGGLVCDHCRYFTPYGAYGGEEYDWISEPGKLRQLDFCSEKCFRDEHAGRNPKQPRKGNRLRGYLIKLCKKIERFLRRNSR